MTPPHTPRITVGPSQLAGNTPPGREVRRFTHNAGSDLVPDGAKHCLEIGPTQTLLADLPFELAALRGELGEIPGVKRVNIMQRYLTIEAATGVLWSDVVKMVAATLKSYFGWTDDPIIKTVRTAGSD